jgi:glyoxylase-like metal-dependent hydrolase (beta-lactamase superfamily II)
MTHLHFDHCGGSVNWNATKTGYEVAFKNAKFWTNDNHWEWATKPNAREKASFLSENINFMVAFIRKQFMDNLPHFSVTN